MELLLLLLRVLLGGVVGLGVMFDALCAPLVCKDLRQRILVGADNQTCQIEHANVFLELRLGDLATIRNCCVL